MFEISKIFNSVQRTFLTIMFIGLAWLISLPTTSVQASPATNYLGTQTLIATQPSKADVNTGGFDELESGKQAARVIPKDLGDSNKDIKGRVERAVGELGNDQYQRVFGGIKEDTKLSDAERKVERNTSDR